MYLLRNLIFRLTLNIIVIISWLTTFFFCVIYCSGLCLYHSGPVPVPDPGPTPGYNPGPCYGPGPGPGKRFIKLVFFFSKPKLNPSLISPTPFQV